MDTMKDYSKVMVLVVNLLVFLSLSMGKTAYAESFQEPLFGPVTCLRESGKPNEFNYTFDKLPGFSEPYRLIVTIGDEDGRNRISSAEIILNGVTVLRESQLNQNVGGVEQEVRLVDVNTLKIVVNSNPGGYIKVSVVGQSIIEVKRWEKTFGGMYRDEGYSAQQTTDGGYIVAGHTDIFGSGLSDVYLIKTDSDGNKMWEKTFGGTSWDLGYSVQQATDGGYIVAGTTTSYGLGPSDVYLIKTDSDGNKMWEKTFGGAGWDLGYYVRQTTDGGYIIAANTLSSFTAYYWDIYLIKTDTDGNMIWEKTFGGMDSDFCFTVQQTIDGGYIVAGTTTSYGLGPSDVYLIKTDSDGNKVWEKTLGGTGSDGGISVQQTGDGGYIVAGHTESFGAGSGDVYLIKTDSDGNKMWEKTFGGANWDEGLSIRQTTDDGYIVAGVTYSFGAGYQDVYLIKTDTAGNKVWEKTFGGTSADMGWSVQQTTDSGYIVAGYTDSFGSGGSDVYLIKTDANGNILR